MNEEIEYHLDGLLKAMRGYDCPVNAFKNVYINILRNLTNSSDESLQLSVIAAVISCGYNMRSLKTFDADELPAAFEKMFELMHLKALELCAANSSILVNADKAHQHDFSSTPSV